MKLTDEQVNPVSLTDGHGNPVHLSGMAMADDMPDEHGDPIKLTNELGQPVCLTDDYGDLVHLIQTITTSRLECLVLMYCSY